MPYLLLLISMSISTFSLANTIEVGSILPSVEIKKEGQATIVDEEIVYQPWISNKDMGQRLAYVQHLAARVGVKELNKNLSDAIVAQQVPSDLLDSVIIINSDDSAFGTAWLISSEIKSNKESYPSSIFINDSSSTVAETWGLPLKSVTSLIVAANGEILFRKDGETSAEDVATVISILTDNLPELNVKPAAVASIVD
jgi:YtfJ family uncharacterized protein